MMKYSKNIDELIVAVLNSEANEQDSEHFEDWLNASHENATQFDYLKKIWRERSSEPKLFHLEELSDKIWQQGVVKGGKFSGYRNGRRSGGGGYWFKVAAAILILIASAYLLYFNQGNFKEEEAFQEATAMIDKNNPAGQKARINLPDGSVVWLNSLSSIRYPTFFSDSARIIELTGEAFFEVKKDNLRPFTVRSGNILTTALGTSFNINAYPDQANIQIGLIAGKVWVRDEQSDKSMILNPNRGAVYNRDDKNMKEVSIDPGEILSWKNGILRFDGEDFYGFIDKLEKWYGVQIIIEGDPPKDWHIRGKFDDEYLSNILASISFNKEFNYNINRKEVVLKFN